MTANPRDKPVEKLRLKILILIALDKFTHPTVSAADALAELHKRGRHFTPEGELEKL